MVRITGSDVYGKSKLEALLDKYMDLGIREIGKAEILKLDPFLRYGKPAKISVLL